MDDDDDVRSIIDTQDSDQEENITPQELIKKVEEAWINEKFAPEILPHKIEAVEMLLAQINYIDHNLKHSEYADFQKTIYQLEADRLRFMVTSYLRIRLEKIERYVLSILKQEEERTEREQEGYLTPAELEFASSYQKAMEEHFNSSLSSLSHLTQDSWKKEPLEPNLSGFVFFKSKGDVEGVAIDDDEGIVDLREGTQMLASYKYVSTLVKSGDVHLM